MEKILKCLTELEQNNNREWFNCHKPFRDEATKEFEDLVQSLIFNIGKSDESILNNFPRDLTFKQVRDTRFSTDKSPYKPAFRAHIAPCGKLPIPVGYFLFIMPNNRSFLGIGLFADMFKDAIRMIRDYIVQHGDELDQIVKSAEFKKYFELKGEKLKKVPRGYDENCSIAEYLKYKSMYIEYLLTDEQLLDNKFVENATEIFLAMKPFNDFLNKALKYFKMPSRL